MTAGAMGRRCGRNRRAPRRGFPSLDARGFGMIEVLVAITIGAIGVLAIAGLQTGAATQSRLAEGRTAQALIAQQVFEEVHREGYAAAVGRTYAVSVAGRPYNVSTTVSNAAIRVRRVIVHVPAVGSVRARNFTMRIHDPRPMPAGP